MWHNEALHPACPLYRVGIKLLMVSQADKEIPTSDVKLELELEPPGGSDLIPTLTLDCALCIADFSLPWPSLPWLIAK